LLRRFSKAATDRYFEFRPSGWVVQGPEKGQPYGSEYEITEESLTKYWSRSQAVSFFKRLLQLRIKFYYAERV
jgi:hypothetical protein